MINMDINILRSVITAFSFVLFIGIFIWAYRPTRKTEFDEAALDEAIAVFRARERRFGQTSAQVVAQLSRHDKNQKEEAV